MLLLEDLIFPFYSSRMIVKNEIRAHGYLGIIYLIMMCAMMFFGSINYTIVHYLFPGYMVNLDKLNIFWSCSIILFAEGFLSYKKVIKSSKTYLPIRTDMSYLFLVIAVVSTLLICISIGEIPILHSQKGINQSLPGGSLLLRCWGLNLFSAISFFFLYMQQKKMKYLFFVFLNVVCSAVFSLRMLPFAILLSLIILLFLFLKDKRWIYFIAIIGCSTYFILNAGVLKFRGDISDNTSAVKSVSPAMAIFQSTFNEYPQLGQLMDSDMPLQYGKTLLSIPVSFIPSPVLAAFGVDKHSIQYNNSAVLFARYLESETSIGLRSGIIGELYLNFSYFGVLLMFFIGRLIGFLNKKTIQIHYGYFSSVLCLSIYVLLIYALIGQIDAIASQIVSYLIWYLIFIILYPKKKRFNERIIISYQ